MTQAGGRNRRTNTTLEEVAHMAGVSRATVSRVVNGSPRVSPDVRSDVQAAIDRLGYVPNRAARSLVTRRSDSIAVVITEPTGSLFKDPFFPRLLRGISTELAARDRQLVLLMPESAADEARTADYLTAGHVDGALLVSLHETTRSRRVSAPPGIPIVMVGRPSKGVQASYVDVDNRQGAQTAVAHLIKGGRRVIATIAGPQDMAAGIDRLRGYRDGAGRGRPRDRREPRGDRRLHPGERRRRDEAAPGRSPRHRCCLRRVRPDGRRRADRPGRRGPAGPRPTSRSSASTTRRSRPATTPQLTSVRQPIEEMGREMARLLVDAVEASDLVPRRVILATELVRRASSAGRPAP